MCKIILLVLLCSFPALGYSQLDSMNHFGKLIEKSDVIPQGSPLLFDSWRSGEITLTNDQKISIEKINLDASRDIFVYEKEGTVYDFVDNAKEIQIYNQDHNPDSNLIFKNGMNSSGGNFVQILTEGKITIFCDYKKKATGEYSSNGFVNTTRNYELYSNYYSLVNNKVTLIKLTPSTLQDLTSDKKDKIDVFIKENKLRVKKEPDFIKAIKFYNSISS